MSILYLSHRWSDRSRKKAGLPMLSDSGISLSVPVAAASATRVPLAAKFSVPLSRARLSSRLWELVDTSVRSAVTMVIAPAGYGKTTVLAGWAASSQTPVAWVSLDATDCRPRIFLSDLCKALSVVKPNFSIGPSIGYDLERGWMAVSLFIDELETIECDFVFVLDNYDSIESEEIHQVVRFLIEHLPARMHLVILSRSTPPLPIALERSRGALSEITAEELQLRGDEVSELLGSIGGARLTDADMSLAQLKLEGWPAGLQLVAHSLRESDDVGDRLAALSGSSRLIKDYFTEVVLERVPSDVREFMLLTSVLERLSGQLCDAILQREDAGYSQAMLERLERLGLFIYALDEERHWYRYHYLLADLLRSSLQVTNPGESSSLCRRAGAWYTANGFLNEAIHAAVQGGDLETAIELIETNRVSAVASGNSPMLLAWTRLVPEAVVLERPGLSLARAWPFDSSDETNPREPYLQAVEAALSRSESLPPDVAQMLAEVSVLRAQCAHDPRQQIALCEQALGLLPPAHTFLRALATLILNSAQFDRTGTVLAESGCTSEKTVDEDWNGRRLLDALTQYWLARVTLRQGRAYDAAGMFQTILDSARGPVACTYLEQTCLLQRMSLLYEWNDLDGVERAYSEILEMGEQRILPSVMALARLTMARVLLARDDKEAGVEEIEHSAVPWNSSHGDSSPLWIATPHLRLLMRTDGPVDLSMLSEVKQDDELTAETAGTWLRIAAALFVLERFDELAELLPRVVAGLRRLQLVGQLVPALILSALLHQARGDLLHAHDCLAEAVTLGEPSGYMRMFLDEGDCMRSMLSALQEEGIAPDYTRKLLAAFAENRTTCARQREYMLSERQISVLSLASQGLSQKEIAKSLGVSVRTVNQHLSNIYKVLGVHSCIQAIRQASALELI